MGNILIADGNKTEALSLSFALSNYGHNITGIAGNLEEALILYKKYIPELIIVNVHLDVRFAGINFINSIAPEIPFIYLTSDDKRTTYNLIKQYTPFAYLITPINDSTLNYTVDLAIKHAPLLQSELNSKNTLRENYLFIKKNHKIIKLSIENILYIQVESNYSTFFTTLGKFIIQSSLNELLLKLPPNNFIRIHRNYIANINLINEFDFDDYTVKISDSFIPIGKKFKQLLCERFQFLS